MVRKKRPSMPPLGRQKNIFCFNINSLFAVAISDKVRSSLSHYIHGDIGNSLEQCMIAADASAKKLFRTDKNKFRMESFFSKYMDIITSVGTPFTLTDCSITNCKTSKAEKLESIFYKYIRCNLIHETEISENIEFTSNSIGNNGNKFVFPTTLPVGICFAVIACEINAGFAPV
jgi:hypothetical protein